MPLFVPHDLLKVLSSYFIDGSHPNEAIFFSPAGNDLNARGREVEHIHTYIYRERERELLRNHPRRMIDSRVFTTYIYCII